MTNRFGEPILGSYKARRIDNECDYMKFLRVKETVDNLIPSLGTSFDRTELISKRFKIGKENSIYLILMVFCRYIKV